MKDSITVLRSMGPRCTKRWNADGTITPREDSKHFSVELEPVSGLADVLAVLQRHDTDPRKCIIRGAPGPETDTEHTRRLLATFPDQAHHWVCFDVDKYTVDDLRWFDDPAPHLNRFIADRLPAEFVGASYVWHLSSSAGHPTAAGRVKAHLFFWLAEKKLSKELEHWARCRGLVPDAIDPVTLRQVQEHFIAAPVLEPGVEYPVRRRSGLVEGLFDHDVPNSTFENIPPLPDYVGDRTNLRDDREVPGIVGAVCRAVSIEDALADHLAHIFEYEGDSDRRLTWRISDSGAPGGAFITDNGLRICNTHAGDPFAGASANVFDLLRHYLHGEADAGLSEERLRSMSPAEWPSHKACAAWAVATLPEVAAELKEARAAARQTAAQEFDDFEDDEMPDQDEPPPAAPAAPVDVTERERVVLRAVASIDEATTATELEQHVAQRLKDLDWSDGERARLAAAVQARFRAITGTALAIATARQWLAPTPAASGFPDVDSDGAPLITYPNVRAVLSRMGATVRYNVIKKEDEILLPGHAFTLDNRTNASLAVVLSECHAQGLKIQAATLKSYLTVISDANQYNPALTWIESREWDGTDRLQAWFDTVQGPAEQRGVKELVMRRWAIQCIAILHNTGQTQARGILTFQGAQYQGKGRWLRSLAPEELTQTGVLLDTHNKDSVKIAISCWLTELGELDATFRRSDLSALKAFISQEKDTFRRPYAAAEGTYPRRTAFFASVNDREFLRDPTGNTRYWVVEVDTVNHEHGLDVQQLWAQVLQLWRGGEQHWLTPEELAVVNEANEQFAVNSPLAELVTTELPWGDEDATFIWATTAKIGSLIGRPTLGQNDAAIVAEAVRKANAVVYGETRVDVVRRKRRGCNVYRIPVSDSI